MLGRRTTIAVALAALVLVWRFPLGAQEPQRALALRVLVTAWDKFSGGTPEERDRVVRDAAEYIRKNMPKGCCEMVSEPPADATLSITGIDTWTVYATLTTTTGGKRLMSALRSDARLSPGRRLGVDANIYIHRGLATEGTVPPPLAKLVGELSQRNAVRRAEAASQLSALGAAARSAADALVRILDDSRPLKTVGSTTDTNPGTEAARALMRIGAGELVTSAVGAAPSGRARINALEAIRREAEMYWPPNHRAAVVEALADEDKAVRRQAVSTAFRVLWRDAIPLLITFIEEPRNRGLRKDVARYLEMLTKQRLGDDPAAWREWWRTTGGRM